MNSKVGLTIKKLRKKENLTQEQLASLLKMLRIKRFLNGNVG